MCTRKLQINYEFPEYQEIGVPEEFYRLICSENVILGRYYYAVSTPGRNSGVTKVWAVDLVS